MSADPGDRLCKSCRARAEELETGPPPAQIVV
jgi:hypothetical protein